MSDKNDDTIIQEDITLEERFAAIESILERMESGETSLDESFALYKKGLSEIKAANDSLDLMEKAMLVLNENGELEEF
jgi:exodeoxyribonuclease VII small subunit